MEGFPRFVGLWVLTAITVVIAVAGVVIQLQGGEHTGAVLLGVYVLVMTASVVTVVLLRRRLR